MLDPYVPYLLRRWNEGCHNGKKLYRQIREQGYTNSEETCARFTAQLRRAEARGKSISSVPRARAGSVAGLSPTAKNVAALFMRHEEKLDEEQEEYLERLCEADEALADTRGLTQEFAEMVGRLEGEELDGWLRDAEESGRTLQRSAAHSHRPVPPAGFRAPNSGLASYRSPALTRSAAMRRSERSGTESSSLSLSAAEGARKGAHAPLTLRPPPALDRL